MSKRFFIFTVLVIAANVAAARVVDTTVCINTSVTTTLNTTGCSGSLSYVWMKSANVTSFTDSVYNQQNYPIPSSSVDTVVYYRRETKSNGASCRYDTVIVRWRSSLVTIKGTNPPLSGSYRTITSCYSERPVDSFRVLVDTIAGRPTYQWHIDNAGALSSVSGANSSSYRPNALQTSTIYACVINSGSGCINDTISYFRYQVRPELKAGRIASKDTAVCSNSTLNFIITNDSSATGGGGPISYQWKMNSSVLISGRISDTLRLDANLLKPGNSYTFTREAVDTACKKTEASNGIWKIIVWDTIKAGTISKRKETVCLNGSPKTIADSVRASGGSGKYEYRWFENNKPTPIPNANDSAYTPVADQSGVFTYHREVRDAVCLGAWKRSAGGDTVIVRDAFKPGTISSVGQEICQHQTIDTIKEVAKPSGGDTSRYWYRWHLNDSPTAIIGAAATSKDYKPNVNAAGAHKYTRMDSNACGTWQLATGAWTLTIDSATKPATPVGKPTLCQYTDTTTDYSIPAISNITNYLWKLTDSKGDSTGMGTITNNGNNISIKWADNFNGICKLKVGVASACGTAYSDSLVIDMRKVDKIKFVQSTRQACPDESYEYEVELIPSATYEWQAWNGTKLSETLNKAVVRWNRQSSAYTGTVWAKANYPNECFYSVSESVFVGAYNVLDLNEIVAKKDKGNPYMLIYPNPAGKFIYQWYKNDVAIDSAVEQFYYPPHYKLEKKLEVGAEYKVFVMDLHNLICGGNFTNAYIVPPISDAQNYFTISPNPIDNGHFRILFNSSLLQENTENYLVTIYSIVGQKIWEQTATNLDEVFVLKPATAGIYMLTLTINNQKYTEKIVVR